MKIFTERTDGNLTIFLSGDLDHHAARSTIPEVSRLIDIELPITLSLDFSNVKFMDSSGIALVIGAYKRATHTGCRFTLNNVPPQAYKVFNAAGICNIVTIINNTSIKV